MSPKTMGKWKGLDLPIPLTTDIKFEHAFFGCSEIKGHCLFVPAALPGPIKFEITFNKGDMKLFEELYKETRGMISCQKTTKINVQYQADFANGSYCSRELIPKMKRDPFISVFPEQPGYYPLPNQLNLLMDSTIAGITNFGMTLGSPHPDFPTYPPSDPYGSQPLFPAPDPTYLPVGVAQPGYQLPDNSIEAIAQPVPIEPQPEEPAVSYPSLESHNALCSYCKKVGPEYEMMKLGCGHWKHNMCLVYYMQNTMQAGGALKSIVCIDCGQPIDYTILKTVGGEIADQLYMRNTLDGY